MKFGLTCTVLLVVIPYIHSIYINSNGTSYFISYPMMKKWHQAERYCTIQGMHLVTMHSPDENNIILNVINQFNTSSPHVHFWTSGNNIGHAESEWYWAETGLPILYTNWIEGAPNSKDRNCLLMHGGVHKFKWYDQFCINKQHFICQDRLTVPDTLKNQRCQSDL